MAVFSTDLSQTVEVLLERKNYNSVKDILSTVNPADIAVIFRDQPAQRLLMLFRLLPKETAADVFVEMEPVLQEQLINAFSDKELADIVNEMYADDAADLVEEMPASVVKRILKQASPDVRRDINELLKYQNMLSKMLPSDKDIIKAFLSDKTYTSIAFDCFISVPTVKYRLKRMSSLCGFSDMQAWKKWLREMEHG